MLVHDQGSLLGEGESSRRLAISVYRRLEDMIFTGALKSGEVLTERRLADLLEVSRTPLRDALLMLEGEGLLKRRGARFLEVRQFSIPEFMHILNIRRLLEPEAARLATERIDRPALEDLRSRLEAAVARESADDQETAELDADLHNLIADTAGNPMMASLIRDLRRRTRIFNLQRMPERFVDTCREHISIIDALLEGNAKQAAQRMVLHIDNVKASILRRLAAI